MSKNKIFPPIMTPASAKHINGKISFSEKPYLLARKYKKIVPIRKPVATQRGYIGIIRLKK